MTSNDVLLLDAVLSEWKDSAPAGLSDSEYFELFALEQLLKDYDLSLDDLLPGRVGGGNDGGVDGFLAFVDNELLDEDSDLNSVKRSPDLRLYMVQARSAQSFQETIFDRVATTIRDILDLHKQPADLQRAYSQALIERAAIFRNALMTLAPRHPRVAAVFALITKGSTANIHPNVVARAEAVKSAFKDIVDCVAEVTFLGARELFELARREPSYTLSLRFIESPVSIENSYIVLANLRDYYSFVTDEAGALRKYIFERNVRDYQGNVEVNRDIQRTLIEGSAPEFWWLNNGVTVIASKASITGKVIALDDVQIVNGLQTSMEVYEYIRANPGRDEKRSLLCRIIVTTDDTTRDRVIKATNFQTAVSAASLKATDQIQRDIESYFLTNNWYYDRRKNYHKNRGRPADRIVSIPYLAQAVMAMGLSEPDNSRARPTSLMKREEDCDRVFDQNVDLAVYLWAAITMKQVDAFLRSHAVPGWEPVEREFRFHLATLLVGRALGHRTYHPSQLQELVDVSFNEDELIAARDKLFELLTAYPDIATHPLDRIAKSREFVTHLLAALPGEVAT
jgi:hypothetical protein